MFDRSVPEVGHASYYQFAVLFNWTIDGDKSVRPNRYSEFEIRHHIHNVKFQYGHAYTSASNITSCANCWIAVGLCPRHFGALLSMLTWWVNRVFKSEANAAAPELELLMEGSTDMRRAFLFPSLFCIYSC